ncbi:hypothetical protein J1605_005064 [Eschrichtius robustus]|uniref:Cyclin N-terminal domain-containing protein n=1 Tax=Eschrichtius robustus TaxID=9764 RepID=A0AB34H9X9_ESCRO|nr:hypothetical protein J1605_005064 [Eschrichtius robustus]
MCLLASTVVSPVHVYLDRLLRYAEIDICPANWERIALGAILLASKAWDDQAVWNVDHRQILKDITVEDTSSPPPPGSSPPERIASGAQLLGSPVDQVLSLSSSERAGRPSSSSSQECWRCTFSGPPRPAGSDGWAQQRLLTCPAGRSSGSWGGLSSRLLSALTGLHLTALDCVFCPLFEPMVHAERNELERQFLELLQFNINVPSSVYAKYYFGLRSLAEANNQSFPSEALSRERAHKLEHRTGSVVPALVPNEGKGWVLVTDQTWEGAASTRARDRVLAT